MRVVIFGATGMVGAGALLECLDDPQVTAVLVIGRHPTGATHPKVTEVLHQDFFAYEGLERRFAECDACFFCLGVSSAGMGEASYHHLTYDLTLAAARAMAAANPQMTFCYVSGEGTDGTERGPRMWARVKGKTENALLALPFKRAYMLRPAYIQPLRGVRSKTALYQAFYRALGFLYPVLRRLAPRYVTTTVNVGRALVRLAAEGDDKRILVTADINRLAANAPPRAGPPAERAVAAGARPDRALRFIAWYKFCKTALLVAVGLGTLRLLKPEVAAWAERWAAALALRHDRRLVGELIAAVSGLSPRRLHELAIGAFVFAALFATEGVGLWRGKRWAEYLTVIATTLFVPVEIVRLERLVTATRLAVLLINLAVVVFLVYRLRRPDSLEPG